MDETSFSENELRRYGAQLKLPGLGREGQAALKRSRVLVVGLGGLGSPASLYLAAGGVGTLGLLDFDRVDESNLQRQVLYETRQIGVPKVQAATERLSALNPHVELRPHFIRLSAANAVEILSGYDLIVDGTDNFPTRYLLSDACALLGKRLVYASIYRFEGQVGVLCAPGGPCYRCLYPAPPPPALRPDCGEGGVLGAVAGVMGALQAAEALKIASGIGAALDGKLLHFDLLSGTCHRLEARRDEACPTCNGRRGRIGSEDECEAKICGLDASITALELNGRLESEAPPLLVDVRTLEERTVAHIGGVLIPLGDLEHKIGELDRGREIVVYCHHGVRSESAAALLRAAGFARVRSLDEGIDGWSRSVDSTIPRY